MNYDGPRLDIDPEAVWRSSWTDFPDMAAAYATVSRTLDASRRSGADSSAFFAGWSTARDLVQNALADSAVNAADTAEAIRQALTAYLETDEQAARLLREAAADNQLDLDQPPPTVTPLWAPGSTGGLPGVPAMSGDDGGQCPIPEAPTDLELSGKAVEFYQVWQRAKRAELNDLHEVLLDLTDHGYADHGPGAVGEDITAAGIPEPDAYDATVAALPEFDLLSTTADGTALGLSAEAVERMKSWLGEDHWGGEAADAYRGEHLSRYPDIDAIQTHAVAALKPLLSDYRTGVNNVRADLGLLLDDAIDACRRIAEEQSVDMGQFVTRKLITTLTLAGAALSGGTALALTAGTTVLQDSLTLDSKGSTADEVRENLGTGVTKILNGFNTFDKELLAMAEAFTANLAAVDAEGLLRIPRPAFADVPDDFLPSGTA